jgi:hypothetical protein
MHRNTNQDLNQTAMQELTEKLVAGGVYVAGSVTGELERVGGLFNPLTRAQ